jgi:hypothetical protein
MNISQLDYQDASAYQKQLPEICFSQNLAKHIHPPTTSLLEDSALIW